jgi:hypothetical protein
MNSSRCRRWHRVRLFERKAGGEGRLDALWHEGRARSLINDPDGKGWCSGCQSEPRAQTCAELVDF